MSLEVGLVGVFVSLIARTLLNEVQDALDIAVQISLCQFTTLYTSHDTVELLCLTRLQHVITSPHLLGTVLTAKPVGHHGSLIAPLIAEDGLHKVLALRGIDAVDIVVGGHHCPGLALLDGNLEALQVNLTEGTL